MEWRRPHDQGALEQAANDLGVTVAEVEVITCVTMPECRLAREYLAWLGSTRAVNTIGVMMENTAAWVHAYERNLAEWAENLLKNGRPDLILIGTITKKTKQQ